MLRPTLRRLRKDEAGAVIIETAFVMPILAIMAFGGYEASHMIARHNELQVAADEAGSILLAHTPETQEERDRIEGIVETTTGLPDENVTFQVKYRCNNDADLIPSLVSCAPNAVISEYIEIRMQDTYTPTWTSFGIGEPHNYDIRRRVQVS